MIGYVELLPPANEVWGKVIFSEVCVILSTGGEYLTRYTPPRTRYTPTPGTRYNPPLEQTHPPEPGTSPLWSRHPPPRTKYTSQEQSVLGDTVNVRAVRILLECNLVDNAFTSGGRPICFETCRLSKLNRRPTTHLLSNHYGQLLFKLILIAQINPRTCRIINSPSSYVLGTKASATFIRS